MICYDLRFPELSLELRKKGADILTFPSAFTVKTGQAHWGKYTSLYLVSHKLVFMLYFNFDYTF